MSASSSKASSEYLNLANGITFARLGLTPLLALLLAFQAPADSPHFHISLSYATSLLFVLCALSDLFDGYLARKYGIVTNFGKFLDPLADKLSVMVVFIMLIPFRELPAWLVLIFLSREMVITGLRGIAAAEGVVLAADRWGKKKTALQNVALTCFLLPPSFLGFSTRSTGWFFLSLALLVSLGSGLNYCYQFFSSSKKRERKSN